jgi:predicted GTPase
MNLHEFFEELDYSLNEETAEYIDNLKEVDLKLLIKRVYENNDLVRNELNRQVKATKYRDLQEVISNLNRDETAKFIYWLSENVFGSNQTIEEEIEKILVK